MSVLKTLRDTVAPELNHLYTTAPAEIAGAIDAGWHGREHALHAFLVARMFGAEADIRSGDFAVLSPFLPPLTSVDREIDHTWCSVNGVAPVDLALNLFHFGQAPQLRSAVVGEGPNGDWTVHYAEDESILDEGFGHGNEIIYIEQQIHALTEAALLENPFLLLPDDRDKPESWTTKYGAGIYAKITLHCHACATRETKSARSRFTREQALEWIAAEYPEPESAIRKALTARI